MLSFSHPWAHDKNFLEININDLRDINGQILILIERCAGIISLDVEKTVSEEEEQQEEEDVDHAQRTMEDYTT